MHKFSWRVLFSWMYLLRLSILIVGLFFYALGVVCLYRSNMGLGPWDVLHQGISFHTPLTFGLAGIVVGIALVAGSLLIKVIPGVGTICNMIIIGIFEDMLLDIRAFQHVGEAFWVWRLLLNIAGVIIVGLGTALYIAPRLGAGPRDGLMLRLHEITKLRVTIVRGCIEVSVLLFGILLGGTIGVGTLIFAFGVGPVIEFGFAFLKKSGFTEWLVPTVSVPAIEAVASVEDVPAQMIGD